MPNSSGAVADAVPEPLLMTAPVAAQRLGVTWITFRRLMDAGEVAYVQRARNGTRWVEEDELHRWIAKNRVGPARGRRGDAAARSRRRAAADKASQPAA